MFCSVTFSLAIIFSAATAITPPDCNVKKSAWCESLTNAKACGAFSYCLASVWPKGVREEIPCNEGQGVVKQFQQTLMDRKHGAAKWTHLEKLCISLDSDLSENCQVALKDNREEVLRLVNSTVRPKTIARLLNLCIAQRDGKKDGKVCNDCKAFLQDVGHLVIGPEIEDTMRQKMKEFCQQMPSAVSDLCLSMTDDWIKHFFMFLQEELKFDRLCYIASFCHQDLNKPSRLFSGNPVTDITCKPCREVMEDVKGFIRNPTIQTDIEEVLESALCTLLPRHMVEGCRQRVKKYSIFMIDFLIMEMDTELMCEAIRLCPEEVKKGKPSLFSTVSAVLRSTTKDIMPLINNMLNKNSAGRSPECSMCEIFIKEITRMFSSEHSKNEILLAAERLCERLPSPWADECKTFVETNGKDIIDSLVHSLTPKEVCQAVGLCETVSEVHERVERSVPVVSMQQEDEHTEKPARRGKVSEWCSFCHLVIGAIQDFATNKDITLALEVAENRFCSLLPKEMTVKCTDMFDRLMAAYLASASTALSPELLCGSMGVCARVTHIPVPKEAGVIRQ